MTHAEFKKAAEKHQVEYKEKYINKDYRKFSNKSVKYWLTDEDGKEGKIYYDKYFDIFKAVRERYPNFDAMRDSNMLRSEHIPFNLFVPLKQNFEFCKKVFNQILGNEFIDKIEKIEIEYAPKKTKEKKYLNDRTSFDAYIEYTCTDNLKGIIGIEVKYTEKEYELEEGSKQEKDINDKTGKYYSVTNESGIYKPNVIEKLKTDLFRQIWRNHLLAESILIEDKEKFKHAHSHSLIFYPSGNAHFTEVGNKYIEMLADDKKDKFGLVTFEKFIDICRNCKPNNEFEEWINYLKDRYII